MEDYSIIILFLFVLFLLLGTGVWVGLALMGVAWVGMELFTTRPVMPSMFTLDTKIIRQDCLGYLMERLLPK